MVLRVQQIDLGLYQTASDGNMKLLSILVILFLLQTQVCLLFYMGVPYIHLQAAPFSSHPATFGDPRPHCL
jgi:hypothetical protein